MSETIEEILSEFAAEEPLYKAFTEALQQLLLDLLRSEQISYAAIESRTKTSESLSEKLNRPGKAEKYEKLSDITDLTGVRCVLYLEDDVERVCQIIRDNFAIDEENSVDKSSELEADRLGYHSKHFVLSLNNARSGLAEFRQYEGLKSEFQVRTVLQHAWAVLDWKFRYKSKAAIPDPIRRQLYITAGLLEQADKNFSAISEKITELKSTYKEMIEHGDLDIDLNSESLPLYLEIADRPKAIIDASVEAGFEQSEINDKSLDAFIVNIEKMQMKTLADLDKYLQNGIDPKVVMSEFKGKILSKYKISNFAIAPDQMLKLFLVITLGQDQFDRHATRFVKEPGIDLVRSVRGNVGLDGREVDDT